MGYTDQLQITSHLGRDLTEREALIIEGVIEAVTQYIDAEIGISYGVSEAGEARYFEGGDKILFIDPIIDIDSVEYISSDDSVISSWDNSQYLAFPLNTPTKTSLEIRSSYDLVDSEGYGLRFPRGRIKVTGKWGDAGGVPKDIMYCATILASKFVTETKNIKSENIEGYSVTLAELKDQDPEVMQILSARKRPRL